jgi:hypothetical protein
MSLGKHLARFEKAPNDTLFAHQRYAVDWFRKNNPRGLCLFWEPGTGKTRPIVTLSSESDAAHVIYISPKSLRDVIADELKIIDKDPNEKNPDGVPRYFFISGNAGNVWDQWNRIMEQIGYRGKFGLKTGKTVKLFIAIDEAHLFSQRISNVLNEIYYGGNGAADKGIYKLYKELRDLENVQFIAASGTPIPNNSFELVPILNIIRGQIHDSSGRFDYAFPDKFSQFYFMFVKPEEPDVARSLFITRIQNMIMWYRIPRGLKNLPIPSIDYIMLVKTYMGENQWKSYLAAKNREESMRGRSEIPREGYPMVGGSSIYRTFTRQVSNFAYPDAADPSTLPKDTFDKLDDYSCKLAEIFRRIDAEPDKLHAINSHFVGPYGLGVAEEGFRRRGWVSVATLKVDIVEDLKKGTKYYVRLTGDEPLSLKSKLLKIINTERNYKDKLIRVLLFSAAAGHGLSIYSFQVVHLFEPNWSTVEEEQTIDRFARINSAKYLPLNQRFIRVYRYVALPPKEVDDILAADEYIMDLSENKRARMQVVLDYTYQASISCAEQFVAENELSAEYIKQKKVPPLRTYFHCLNCTAELKPSIYLQLGLGLECSSLAPKKPKKGIKVGDNFLLDPTNGLGWANDQLIISPILLQELWSIALGHKTGSK